jgi:hypothetical protein
VRSRHEAIDVWLVILGVVSSQASSQHLLKEVSGDWVRVEGESESTLSIEISHDGVAIADHLDGEGSPPPTTSDRRCILR